MPDLIDADGLQVASANEILSVLKTGLDGIYGTDINIDQNSPDGQLVNIFAQACVDIRELVVQTYNSFDPDRAVGRQQDERYVINNIERAGGTFTITPIDLTFDRTVALQGLDGKFNDIDGTGYTVQDNAGQQFILVDSETFVAGTYSRNFRAQTIGQIETTLNTITNATTIVLGVTVINNGSAPLEIGQREETDPQFRVRRQYSVALNATGYLNGLLGDVLNLSGVTDAKLYENVTNVVDADGIPAHGVWLIVEGGANEDIGALIYGNKSYGANMKGDVDVPITTASGGIFDALFDRPEAEDLFIRFEIKRTVVGAVYDNDAISQLMADSLKYSIGEYAETSRITVAALAAINATGGQGVPINVEVSNDNATWVDFLNTTTKDSKFTLDPDNIAITVVV